MNQLITVSPKTIGTIAEQLTKLAKDVQDIKAKLFEEEPLYGSERWWEWAERKADQDIKAGRVIRFDSISKAIKWLNS